MEGKDSADAVEWTPLEDRLRPFDVINGDLAALGALSVDDFLNDNFNANPNFTSASFDSNLCVQVPEALAESSSLSDKEKENRNSNRKRDSVDKPGVVTARNAVSILRQTCQAVFGTSDPLKYDYQEDNSQSRQCILTITRPNGATRSYASGLASLGRTDVKGLAAQAAINLGAIDFITYGDTDALKAKQGLLLNPLDVIDAEASDTTTPVSASDTPVKALSPTKEDPSEQSVKEIDTCCHDWRAGKIKPRWFAFTAIRNKKKHGAAVRITLNPHVFRSYAVEAIYDSPNEAKSECAKAALQEGILEFIMYGNGQSEPAKIHDDDLVENMSDNGTPPPTKAMSLQEYYDSLPKPFPEDLGPGNAVEINAPGYLNVLFQAARGGRINAFFQPIVDSVRQLHGCILRVDRPGETKTYIMDPIFPKRVDAKPAVCFLALSQGFGNYIRGIQNSIDNKITPALRVMANARFMQALSAECARVRQGNRPNFLFSIERDAFACTLTVDISEDESRPDVREYSVDADYRNKADAKAGVVAHAIEQGLIDLLRFRGSTPPPDYTPYWDSVVNGKGDTYNAKRKEPVELDTETRDLKKRRKGNRDESPETGEIVPPLSVSTPAKKLPEHPHGLPMKPVVTVSPSNGWSNGRSWKKPQPNVPRGLGPTNAHAHASLPRSVGQDRSGNRSEGLPLPVRHDDRDRGHGRNERDYIESYPSVSSYPPPAASVYPPYDDGVSYRADYPYNHPREHYPPESYPPSEHYPPSNYGHGYSHTPSPSHTSSGSAYHPSTVYHSPPPPQHMQPSSASHYSGYYAAGPPHGHYAHYPYAGSYQHPPHSYVPYPHDPYASHSGHVVYSPPPPPPMMPSPTHVQHIESYPQRYRSPPFVPSPHHPPPPRSPVPPPPPPPSKLPPTGPRSRQVNRPSNYVPHSDFNSYRNGNGGPRNRRTAQDDSARNRMNDLRREIPRAPLPVDERDVGGRNLGRQPSSSSHSSNRTADTERRPSTERSSTSHQDESTIFFGQQPPDDIEPTSRSPSPEIIIPPNAIIASDPIVERTPSPPPPSHPPASSNPPAPITSPIPQPPSTPQASSIPPEKFDPLVSQPVFSSLPTPAPSTSIAPPPMHPARSDPPVSQPTVSPLPMPAPSTSTPPPPPPSMPLERSDPPVSRPEVSPLTTLAPATTVVAPPPPPKPKPKPKPPYSINSPPPNSNLCMLYEFCANQKMLRPSFYYQVVKRIDGDGIAYKVWAEKDAQRLELPSPFLTIEEGCEKLAKRVMQWERNRLKRNASS